jgi:hypothetical protein
VREFKTYDDLTEDKRNSMERIAEPRIALEHNDADV